MSRYRPTYFRPRSVKNAVPNEIWMEICWQLDFKDLVRVAQIKPWHGVATEVLYVRDGLFAQDAPLTVSFGLQHDQIDATIGTLQERHHWGSLALAWGAERNDTALIKRSIDYGIGKVINYRRPMVRSQNWFGTATPLHVAATLGHDEVVALLLDNGADLDTLGAFGSWTLENVVCTPLSSALEYLKEDLALMLLKHGANQEVAWVGTKSDQTLANTALLLATRHHCEKVVRELLNKYSPNVNAACASGITPLQMAAEGELPPEILQKLMQAGADARARDRGGRTALHRCAERRTVWFEEVVSILIDAGADVDAQDQRGWTPLSAAASKTNTRTLRCLVQDPGADPRVGQQQGVDPWSVLASEEYSDDRPRAAPNTLECLKILHEARVSIDQGKISAFLHVNSFNVPYQFHKYLTDEPDWKAWYLELATRNWTTNNSLLFLFTFYPPPVPGAGDAYDALWKHRIRLIFASAAMADERITRLLLPYVDRANTGGPDRMNTLMLLLGNESYDHGKHGALVARHLSRGVDPGDKDIMGSTCFHHLAGNSRMEDASFCKAFTLLITYRSMVNYQDNAGNTPLHILCSRRVLQRDLGKAAALLEARPDMTLRNRDGDTPMDVFMRRGRSVLGIGPDAELLQMLEEAEARQGRRRSRRGNRA